MRRLILLAAFVPVIAAARTCTPGEYAQYKDKAARNIGALAHDYCAAYHSAVLLAPVGDNSCLANMSKISDAATAMRKEAAFNKLIGSNDLCADAHAAKGVLSKCTDVAGNPYFTNLGCKPGDTLVRTIP